MAHMLKYHIGVPLVIFVLLLAVGVPVGPAIYVGAMTGCLSMMVMMMGGRKPGSRDTSGAGSHGQRDARNDTRSSR